MTSAKTNLCARVIPGNSKCRVDVPYVMIPVPLAALSEQDPSEAHLSDSDAGYTDTSAPESARNNKETLFSPVLLAHPKPKAKLSLTTDASDIAIGAVLAQEDGRPLGFFSRKQTSAQQKYSAFDKELLGIKEAIRHFHHMVEGRQFIVYTGMRRLPGEQGRKTRQVSLREVRRPGETLWTPPRLSLIHI